MLQDRVEELEEDNRKLQSEAILAMAKALEKALPKVKKTTKK